MLNSKTQITGYLTILFNLYSIGVFSQTDYQITGFSEHYTGLLTIDKGFEEDVFKKGSISIFKTDTTKSIITIQSEELTIDFDTDGNIQTNVLEIPYGNQSIIIAKDFNFDGLPDLAIMDGQNSCYHGPSFQIYLQTGDRLKHSPEFTRLAQDYCGMFFIDYDNQTIHTSTKSGCCWHQYSEFKVEYNAPVAVKILEIGLSADGILEDHLEKTRVGNQMVEKKYNALSDDIDVTLIYALTFKNGKKMELYHATAYNEFLLYAFRDKDEKIEFAYTDQFVFDKNKNTLTFTNQDVTYQIYNGGIIISTPKQKTDLKAENIEENTSLSSLSELSLNNLIVE
ncbi:XAC2610-related protein [Olleya sp. Bg11-27]|uniref:XAC2610-related protein n=1 Tax=Olleya sp. Bg11-27 TaxID=2058135 RepID=UPI000C31B21B|nr:hypothetical protein [Olleya sp. Bg11-27]AUC77057.1 hypothetical protein CW732_15785 [Olleya sp. Bg11-27]